MSLLHCKGLSLEAYQTGDRRPLSVCLHGKVPSFHIMPAKWLFIVVSCLECLQQNTLAAKKHFCAIMKDPHSQTELSQILVERKQHAGSTG